MYNGYIIKRGIMPKGKSRQSIAMHRKVQVADIRKRSRGVVSDATETAGAQKSTATEAVEVQKNAMTETARAQKNTIVHFAAEPVLESEMIQDAIQAVTNQEEQKLEPIVVKRETKGAATKKDAVAEMKLLLPVNATRPTRAVRKPTKTMWRCGMDIKKKSNQMPSKRLSAREIKEQEIAKAINATNRQITRKQAKARKYPPMEFGFKKVALALAMSAAAVLGIVYLVDTNSPDISLKVAAMQNGINAVYPEYTPRGYILSDITSENGKVTLNFKNPETGTSYSLVEENIEASDTTTLAEYVSDTFGENYTKLEEQGTIVYIGSGGAAWVDGGVFYKLKVSSGSLTRKQILTIATTK